MLTRWNLSPRSKAKHIANRLISQTEFPTIKHTKLTNTPTLCTHIRCDVSPTMRARSIVNRLINEHHTCKNNNVSNTTNDTGSVIYPNKSIKPQTTQREKK